MLIVIEYIFNMFYLYIDFNNINIKIKPFIILY